MKEQNWKRKEYESWDEAFRGLTPLLRQQSVRVAAYTQALFVQACSLRFAVNTKDGEERMRGQYADLAYKCGMYHQLGKALVPPEYQLLQKDFTEEERAVYEKYQQGRPLTRDEAHTLLPTRAEFVALWRYLQRQCLLRGFVQDTPAHIARAWAKAGGQRETLAHTLVCLDVFAERGLILLSRQGDTLTISINPVEGKVDLEASAILLRLRELAGP